MPSADFPDDFLSVIRRPARVGVTRLFAGGALTLRRARRLRSSTKILCGVALCIGVGVVLACSFVGD